MKTEIDFSDLSVTSRIILGGLIKKYQKDPEKFEREVGGITSRSVKKPGDTRVCISLINNPIKKGQEATYTPQNDGMPGSDVRVTTGVFYLKKTFDTWSSSARKYNPSFPYRLMADIIYSNASLSGPVMWKHLAEESLEYKWINENCVNVDKIFKAADELIGYKIPIVVDIGKLSEEGKSAIIKMTSEEYQEQYDEMMKWDNLETIMARIKTYPDVKAEMEENRRRYEEEHQKR